MPSLSTLVSSRPHMLAALAFATMLLGLSSGYGAARLSAQLGKVDSHRIARTQTVQAQLDQVSGDYILAAGDSHVESWLAGSLCGLPVVNAGLAGATIAEYRRFIESVRLPRPPRAAIITIGTNDAQLKRIADPAKSVSRFTASLGSLLGHFDGQRTALLLTAIPGLDRAKGFSPDLARRLTESARTVCEAGRCRFFSPFEKAATAADGVHLANYAASYGKVEATLCDTLGPAAAMLQSD